MQADCKGKQIFRGRVSWDTSGICIFVAYVCMCGCECVCSHVRNREAYIFVLICKLASKIEAASFHLSCLCRQNPRLFAVLSTPSTSMPATLCWVRCESVIVRARSCWHSSTAIAMVHAIMMLTCVCVEGVLKGVVWTVVRCTRKNRLIRRSTRTILLIAVHAHWRVRTAACYYAHTDEFLHVEKCFPVTFFRSFVKTTFEYSDVINVVHARQHTRQHARARNHHS